MLHHGGSRAWRGATWWASWRSSSTHTIGVGKAMGMQMRSMALPLDMYFVARRDRHVQTFACSALWSSYM